ncbi:MAG: hypothetical protein IJK99_08270 [Bacteroidales bacterium]|nr:hypothetical protein [Bacteroidales bacterium]
MKRYLLLLTLIVLLFDGCTRCGRTPDTAPDTAQTDTVTAKDSAGIEPAQSSDSLMPMESTTDGATAASPAILRQDSAEITNLRLLTRKQKVIYDASLLVGEWVRGTEHEVYLADGTGRMWDTADDVSDAEAQRFNWTLDSNLLTLICHLELGGVVPKRYVVTFADDENLSYNDPYGKAYLWDKK